MVHEMLLEEEGKGIPLAESLVVFVLFSQISFWRCWNFWPRISIGSVF